MGDLQMSIIVGEDADNVGAPLDLDIQPVNGVCGMLLGCGEVLPRRECPIFCVTAVWSMLPERSKDDDDFQGTAGRTSERLRAA
jgi:hypothetical protein